MDGVAPVAGAEGFPAVELGDGGASKGHVAPEEARGEGAAFEIGADGEAGEFEDRGEDVHGLDELGATSGGDAGGTDEEGDAGDGVVAGVALAVAPDFAEPFAVVGEEDDDGLLGGPGGIEGGEDAPEMTVHLAQHGVVAALGFAVPLIFAGERDLGVQIEEALRNDPRRVGGEEGGDEGEGAVRGLGLEELNRALATKAVWVKASSPGKATGGPKSSRGASPRG